MVAECLTRETGAGRRNGLQYPQSTDRLAVGYPKDRHDLRRIDFNRAAFLHCAASR